ncbi:MAG: hypothetical protein PW735_02065 [Acidobacteriaceae bacterium]|nr:hypothetical protein [Acidobacteriaceae bacterium]
MGRLLVLAGLVCLHTPVLYAQAPSPQDETTRASVTSCCGVVTPAGERLRAVLDSMDVEHRWQQNMHVNWETGEPTGAPEQGSGPHTHCSAFAAAVGKRLDVYMLRPPEHGQTLLASAQGRWFASREGVDHGWRQVFHLEDAQRLANQGNLVVLDYVNPNRKHPGHIAIVRPAEKSWQSLREDGPETTQAGAHNFTEGNARFSFSKHTGAWPNEVLAFVHTTKLSQEPAGGK